MKLLLVVMLASLTLFVGCATKAEIAELECTKNHMKIHKMAPQQYTQCKEK